VSITTERVEGLAHNQRATFSQGSGKGEQQARVGPLASFLSSPRRQSVDPGSRGLGPESFPRAHPMAGIVENQQKIGGKPSDDGEKQAVDVTD
jgi:hypothetical protein